MHTSPLTVDEVLRREKWLIYILAAIQFVHILDFVILMPLGPMLMRIFDVNPSQFGLLVSSYTFAAGAANFGASFVGDRFERKHMLLFCFAGFIIGTLLCALAPNFSLLLAARIFAGAFGGVLNAVVFALISDLIPPERRGTANGIIMSAFSISSVLGVPIGLALADMWDWHAPFLLIVGLGLVFWMLASALLPLAHNVRATLGVRSTIREFARVATMPLHLQSIALTSLLAFSIFLVIPFISPSMVRNVRLAESDLKYIYLVGGAFTIFSARFIGRMCDRLGSFKVFTATALFSLLPIALITHLGVTPLPLALTVSTLFMMSGSGRFIPAMTMLSLVVEPKNRGTFMGLENAIRQVASGLASLTAGVIIVETVDGRLANFNLVGVLAVSVAVVAWFFARKVAAHLPPRP